MCSNHPQVPTPAASTDRHCYRCNTCLCVYVCEQQEQSWPGRIVRDMGCLVCGNDGNVEYLGRIGLDKNLEKDDIVCKCDERCIWASGPICTCMCGGRNHQSGPEGYTQVLKTDKIRLTCLDEETVTKHQEIAREFLAEIAAAESRQANFQGGYSLRYRSEKLLREGSRGRAHKNRIDKLRAAFTQNAQVMF